MYRRKGKQSEYQTFIRKFLEHGKDPLKRLKLLRSGIGLYTCVCVCLCAVLPYAVHVLYSMLMFVWVGVNS